LPEKPELELLIRPVQHSDLPRIAALERLCYPQPWPESRLRHELENPLATFELAECGGELAGYLICWQVLDEVEIQNIATAPFWRRHGVGRRLLEHLCARSRSNRMRRLLLEVRAGNLAAINLYRLLGFRVDGCRRGYYPDGEDAQLMSLEL